MRKFKWSMVIQFALIAIGLIAGLYFSFMANQKHAVMGHGMLDTHTSKHQDSIDISNDSIIPEIVNLEVT